MALTKLLDLSKPVQQEGTTIPVCWTLLGRRLSADYWYLLLVIARWGPTQATVPAPPGGSFNKSHWLCPAQWPRVQAQQLGKLQATLLRGLNPRGPRPPLWKQG